MYMPLDLILIYFFIIGIVTGLVSIQDPLFNANEQLLTSW